MAPALCFAPCSSFKAREPDLSSQTPRRGRGPVRRTTAAKHGVQNERLASSLDRRAVDVLRRGVGWARGEAIRRYCRLSSPIHLDRARCRRSCADSLPSTPFPSLFKNTAISEVLAFCRTLSVSPRSPRPCASATGSPLSRPRTEDRTAFGMTACKAHVVGLACS